MSVFVEYTVKEVFEALAKDGFEHLRSEWFAEDLDGVVTGACVLGQGAINLGVEAADDEDESTRYTLFRELNKFTIPRDSRWASEYSTRRLADVIIEWNDKEVVVRQRYKFVLKTYGEVIEMAKEVMEPHFEEKIKLRKREWKIAKIIESTPMEESTNGN